MFFAVICVKNHYNMRQNYERTGKGYNEGARDLRVVYGLQGVVADHVAIHQMAE
jgi:hypothetical protein